MCACGRTRTEVVTSVQAGQELAERQAAERALYDSTVNNVLESADALLQSAANAIGNAHS